MQHAMTGRRLARCGGGSAVRARAAAAALSLAMAAPVHAAIPSPGFVLSVSGSTQASTVGKPTANGDFDVNSSGPVTSSVSGTFGAASATADASLRNNGVVSASAQAIGYQTGAGSVADVSYYFRLTGPELAAGVPLRIQALGMVDGGGADDGTLGSYSAQLTFQLWVVQGFSPLLSPLKLTTATGDRGWSGHEGLVPFSFDQTLMLPTNVDIAIRLAVSATASAGQTTSCIKATVCEAHASASLDPSFTIGAGYDGYTLVSGFPMVFSHELASSVPEPSSGALMGIGGAVCVAWGRRRRAVGAAMRAR